LAICLSKYALGSAMSSSKIKTSISKSIWKGRLEKISNNNLFYDVAHNYEGIKAMLNTINVLYPNKEKVGLFCIKSDKNISAICKLLKNNFKKLILCSDKDGYLVKASDLLSIMNEKNIECFSVESVDEGVSLLNEYDNPNYINLVFGSHYVASEVYSSIEKYFDRTYN
jgi:dihydrofolate synthase/folylpolyglutamate synthase